MMNRAGLLLLAAWIPSIPSPAGAQDEREPDLARIRLVCAGDYLIGKGGHPAIGPADIETCRRAIAHDDAELATWGCHGMGALSSRSFFRELDQGRLDTIVDLLIRRFGDESPVVAQAAARALSCFARAGAGQAAGSGAERLRPLLTGPQCRRVVSQCLALVAGRDPGSMRRAGAVLRDIVDRVGAQVHVEIARTLLDAIARLARRELADAGEEQNALSTLKRALATVPPPDPRLGAEMATLFLADAKRLPANHWSVYSAADCLRALARCLPTLAADRREQVLSHLCAAAADRDLFFMTTSGVRSPFHHHGVTAVVDTVPHLDAAELKRAMAAVRGMREVMTGLVAKQGSPLAFQQRDLESVFKGAEPAFAARLAKLAKPK